MVEKSLTDLNHRVKSSTVLKLETGTGTEIGIQIITYASE